MLTNATGNPPTIPSPMKHKSLRGHHCPIARTLDIVGDGWTLLVVGEALAGTTRFGDFRKHLGLARNILSARLRLLVEHGILETRACADRCDWNEYHLTAKGRQLQPVLAALRQ